MRVFIKRDDCTGLVLGGNKARHNEFLLADALASGCDMLVWGALVQSNNCRQTAASCAKLGLECRLYLSKGTLLDRAAGESADRLSRRGEDRVHGRADRPGTERAPGGEGRGVPAGGAEAVLLGPAASRAARRGQLCALHGRDRRTVRDLGLKPDALYVSSAGATGAGVALGKALLGLPYPVRLICPMHWPWHIPTRIADDANAAAKLLGLPHRLTPADIDADESHIAPGYAQPSPAGREAMHLLATTEAILLDHVYTAKALAALIADVRAGKYRSGSTLLFIHTGGVPAIFAEPESALPQNGQFG